MKVDMNKLNELNKLTEPQKRHSPYQRLAKKGACFAACLALVGAGTVYQSMMNRDSASADVLYQTLEADPSFTVQHVGDVSKIDIQPGEGAVTVLAADGESWHAGLNEDGTLATVTSRMTLYEEYITSWRDTDTIEEISFLNGNGGAQADGYVLKEVWFGKNKISQNESDFLILTVPETDGQADLSCITLTNNPEHPKLSVATGGYYAPDSDGKYTVCIQDGDVIRLVFGMDTGYEFADVNVFDYDVSDGGYYLEDDYFHLGSLKATSGQGEEKGEIYVNAIGNGIHSEENYSGSGPKLAFGGADIGTDLEDEYLTTELDTLNIWNYEHQGETYGTGVTTGLSAGVDAGGNLVWADHFSSLNLFGAGSTAGRTNYTEEDYSLTFEANGFTRTLSGTECRYGEGLGGLNVLTDVNGNLTNNFWILDSAPSYGTDGHDPIWGTGSEHIQYYRTFDRSPEPFKASIDGLEHNKFFGFSYTEDFTLSPGYAGALDFFGYSDDDMWVYAGRIGDDGQVMTDTVVQVADLGGVHNGAAYYSNLWNVIDKVPYGEEAQTWRLFVFWLERDGLSASCYMNFTLPEAALTDVHEFSSVQIEAGNYGIDAREARTFIFNDSSYNRYQGTYSDGSAVTIVSGKEFNIPSGSYITIEGLSTGTAFTVQETGSANVWVTAGDRHMATDSIEGVIGTDRTMTFVSTANAGILSIAADADGTPEGGYRFRLTVDAETITDVLATDANDNLVGNRFVDNDGQLVIALEAGEMLTLYNLPENVGFTLVPEPSPGYHVSEIVLNNAGADDTIVTGQFPAYVVYRYEVNEILDPSIAIEQSVSGDWGTDTIVLGAGALLSYKISVTNPNDMPIDVMVEDTVPEGLEIMTTSLLDGYQLDGQTLSWNLSLEPNSVTELSFTCQVITEGSNEFNNTAWILKNDEEIASSITVMASMP